MYVDNVYVVERRKVWMKLKYPVLPLKLTSSLQVEILIDANITPSCEFDT